MIKNKIFRALVVACFFLVVANGSVSGKKWTVTVRNYSFFPYNLTHVKAHDTIQWVWESGNHTTTSTSIPGDAMDWDYPINHDINSFIYIPTVDGIYYYQSTPDTAKVMTGHFVVSGSNGILDDAGIDFRIFPNPGSGLVTIWIPSGFTESSILEIYNNEGKMIYVGHLLMEALNHTGNFNLGTLSRGVYIFKLSHPEKKSLIQRVIRE
ncbi:MAG: T9SS type A sorting domain-containing protein [Bacteroidetes bacterium]|nr:T9SS type A sorting domain-containing protein [Bacteroidota bacterium]